MRIGYACVNMGLTSRKKKLGGPINVHQVDPDTLKFRRKKDITIYLLFTK